MSENQVAVKEADIPEVIPGFGSSVSFELALRQANVLSRSTLVPKEYQGKDNIANCMIALNMANRMGADPLMVMQNLYVVYGRPGWSSQFLIATLNGCGRFQALRYEWTGKPNTDTWGCRAWTIERATGEKLVGSEVTIAIAKKEGWHGKNGSKWGTMPEQMLMYRAASWFVRAYAPELAMGMQTADELEDVGPRMTVDGVIAADANTGDYIDLAPEINEPAPPSPQPEQAPPALEQPTEQGTLGGTDVPGF